ncbi:hypothetical protein NFI96_009707 [Prochilodus magdalenae]|nr:hypothetical protein NFI96_009707 [Prochilodus magdalenae]
MMVEWTRTDTGTDDLVHLYEEHKDRNYEQAESYQGRTALFKEELQKGNTSLKLSAVQPSDHGAYKCLIQDKSWKDAITLYVEVNVQFKIVGAAAPLVGEVGEDLILPCSIKPSISAVDATVEWTRLHQDDKLVHLYEYYEDRNYKQMESYRRRTALFKEELRRGNTSLKLSALQLSDEGAYRCNIITPDFNDYVTVYVEAKDKSSKKKLSPAQCSVITYMRLQSEHVKKEFDLKKYNTSEEGYRRLIPAITNYRQAQFAGCNLTAESFETLCATLETENSSLRELDLSNSDLQDSGLEKLSAGLKSSHCKLEILRLALCNLDDKVCENLGSLLKLENSSLKELDLSNNDVQNSGVELLSAGLMSSHCKLEILRLSGCMISKKGCSSLASALNSMPSRLKELDLTYNHPGESGGKLLSARLEDPHCSLNTLGSMHVNAELQYTDSIIPWRLNIKLRDLGLNCSLSNCIWKFLTDRPKVVKMCGITSSSLTRTTSAPLLYSLYTYNCTARHSSSVSIKFVDDTTTVSLVSNNNKEAYREEPNLRLLPGMWFLWRPQQARMPPRRPQRFCLLERRLQQARLTLRMSLQARHQFGYKQEKTGLLLKLRESTDLTVRNAKVKVLTGRRWNTQKEVD